MPRIFISYRREDSIAYAGRLYDRLRPHFGLSEVFMDVDTLRPGVDFVATLEEAVSKCDVLLAVIGRVWLKVTDGNGRPRITNPDDFVRIEIATALTRNINVIPVLVGGASMPRSNELPGDLSRLSRRHALEIPDITFHAAATKLIEAIEKGEIERRARAEQEQSDREAAARAEKERSDREAAAAVAAPKADDTREARAGAAHAHPRSGIPEKPKPLKSSWKGQRLTLILLAVVLISVGVAAYMAHSQAAAQQRKLDVEKRDRELSKLLATLDARGTRANTGVSAPGLPAVKAVGDAAAPSNVRATSAPNAGSGTLSDPRDQKQYKWVRIGSKAWFATNLAFRSASGFFPPDDSKVDGITASEYIKVYGGLYTWEVARSSCPEGWHLPSRSEWEDLIKAHGGATVAGRRMSGDAGEYSGWGDWNRLATNEFGFNLLPGGRYAIPDASLEYRTGFATYWSATEASSTAAYAVTLQHFTNGAYVNTKDTHYYALNVRCAGN